jgi:virginiamycin A acetyltransferase
VAARAVVTKDVPPYAIVAGVPAAVIGMRFPDAVVERLLELQPWRFGPDDLQPLGIDRPETFIDSLEKKIATFNPGPRVRSLRETN